MTADCCGTRRFWHTRHKQTMTQVHLDKHIMPATCAPDATGMIHPNTFRRPHKTPLLAAGAIALAATCLSATGCGPEGSAQAQAEESLNKKMTVSVRNRSGQAIQRVHISNFDATLGYGTVESGATDKLQLDSQALPKEITVQWQSGLSAKGSAANNHVTLNLHQAIGKSHKGSILITITSDKTAQAAPVK